MRAASLSSLLFLAASVAGGCETPYEEAHLGLSIQRLDGPGLPAQVTRLRLSYRLGEAPPQVIEAKVSELATEDGRRRFTLDALPTDTRIRVRVEGLLSDLDVGFVGSVGPFTLAPGEQLRQAVVLSPARTGQRLEGPGPAPRFLHTASALTDGRVLIAGGFSKPVPADCPAEVPQTARCFRVAALDDAWVFHPDALRFDQVQGGMLEARAGHTATSLSDGRVLLAGGASEALLVLGDAQGPLIPRFIASDAERDSTLSASFEMFESAAAPNGQTRDAASYLFVGSAQDPDVPGSLLAPRFLHAAAENAAKAGQVVLAGGLGSARSMGSYEIFEARRPGGYGVYADSLGQLLVPRSGAVALGLKSSASGFVWLFGGAAARSNDELAERWTSQTGEARGVLAYASESAFPQPEKNADKQTPRPAYAFPQSLAARFSGLQQALVMPALPPLCNEDGDRVFSATSVLDDGTFCEAQDLLRAGFLLDATTGAATPYSSKHPHLLGAATELEDGSIVLSGGQSNLVGDSSLFLEHIALADDSSGPRIVSTLAMLSPRSLHTTTSLPEGGALSVGGIHFVAGKPTLSDAPELVRW